MNCSVCEGSGFQFKMVKECEKWDSQEYEYVFLCKCPMGKWRAAKYQTYTTVDGIIGRHHMHPDVPLKPLAHPVIPIAHSVQTNLDDEDQIPWL